MADRNVLTRAGVAAPLNATEHDQNHNSFAGTVDEKTGATYTAVYTDQNKTLELNNASMDCTLDAIATIAAAADTDDWKVWLKNINAADATISRSSTDTFDGATSLTLKQNEAVLLQTKADGTAWNILVRTRDVFNTRQEWNKGADLASANDLTIGTDGNSFDVTGTTTINGINDDVQAGALFMLQFDGILTLKHDTAPSANFAKLDINGGADYTTAAGDRALVESGGDAGDMRVQIFKADGTAVVAAAHIDIRDQARGLVCSRPTAATVDIDADEIILQTAAGLPHRATSVDLTVDITASGANGLDTGSEAGDTMYFLWVIYNPATTTVAGLLSTDSAIGSITLPSGYTYAALVGAVYNDSASDLLDFEQTGNLINYVEEQSVISSGMTTDTWTSISFAPWVPTIAKEVIAIIGYNTAVSNESVGLSPYSTGLNGMYTSGPADVGQGDFDSTFSVDYSGARSGKLKAAQTMYYYTSVATGSIGVFGFTL